MSDKYELKCQSTDNDNLEDESEQILLPEKKNIAKTKTTYTFKDFSQSYIFQIIMALISVCIVYYGMKYLLSRLIAPPIVMKGGRRIR